MTCEKQTTKKYKDRAFPLHPSTAAYSWERACHGSDRQRCFHHVCRMFHHYFCCHLCSTTADRLGYPFCFWWDRSTTAWLPVFPLYCIGLLVPQLLHMVSAAPCTHIIWSWLVCLSMLPRHTWFLILDDISWSCCCDPWNRLLRPVGGSSWMENSPQLWVDA